MHKEMRIRMRAGLAVILILGVCACIVCPAFPALAWTDRPAATTEDPGHAWTVVFDDPMDTATMNSQNIYVSTDQNGGSRVDGVEASAADSTHAVLSPPPGGWVIGTTYYLIVTQNVLTGEGMPLEDGVRMQFTVQPPSPVITDSGIKVFLEDQPLAFTVPPQTISGRVMVPMRPIFEAMGATLDWDAATQTATAVKGGTTVITQIGNSNATINGVVQALDVPPTAINGSTLAPLRFVAEAFGYHVKWDGTSQTAYISTQQFSTETPISIRNTGDLVEFGHYEQDNDLLNGPEPITWRVLAVENGQAFLISEQALDCKQYNVTRTDVTWETCSLRQWLNHDFYNAAFSSSEQDKIAETTLQNPNNSWFNSLGGNPTIDRIFLLSLDEADRLFASDKQREAQASVYAQAHDAWVYEGVCFWWLRSPGLGNDQAAGVDYGALLYHGNPGRVVDDGKGAVRPALWIYL